MVLGVAGVLIFRVVYCHILLSAKFKVAQSQYSSDFLHLTGGFSKVHDNSNHLFDEQRTNQSDKRR